MPLAVAIVDLETQVKPYLSIDVATFDTLLTSYIDAASQMVVNRIGQVAGTPTVEEWHDGGTQQIVLRNQAPIQSVTSVLESFGTVVYTLSEINLDTASGDAYAYTVDLTRGLLTRRAAGAAVSFAPGTANVHVTYVAGYSTAIPADITLATLLLIKHLWDADQRGPKSRGGGADQSSAAYALPNRVLELLAPYMVPGIG